MKCPYCQNENEVEVKQTEFFTGWIVKCFGCGLTSPQMKEKHEAVSLWYQIRFVSEDSQTNVEAPKEYNYGQTFSLCELADNERSSRFRKAIESIDKSIWKSAILPKRD